MPTTEKLSTPAEIDSKLAELYYEIRRLSDTIDIGTDAVKRMAGAKYYYRGRRRVTDMPFDSAREILEEAIETGDYRLSSNFSYSSEQGRQALAKYDDAVAKRDETVKQMHEIEALYTGWSRFFLVTSSQGHIHSSMSCSTCRPTTAYGWLPGHSGKGEAEVVKELGPALCSVCFPSAPTEWQGQKLSKKQAEDILAGRQVKAEPAKEYCPGSGQYVEAINPRLWNSYGRCPHCRAAISRTASGRLRKHTAKKA